MLERLVGLRKGGQRRLETLIELGQARVIALGEQVETVLGHVLEPLVGLHARQTKGWPPFEREQIARVAKEVCDHLSGFGLWRCEGVPRRGALGGWRRGLGEWTGQQAGHRQDAGWAGRRAGFLTDQVADLLTHGFAQLTLEGCVDLGEGFG